MQKIKNNRTSSSVRSHRYYNERGFIMKDKKKKIIAWLLVWIMLLSMFDSYSVQAEELTAKKQVVETTEEIVVTEEISTTEEEVPAGEEATTEEVAPTEEKATTEEATPAEEKATTEEVTPAEEKATTEEVAPAEEKATTEKVTPTEEEATTEEVTPAEEEATTEETATTEEVMTTEETAATEEDMTTEAAVTTDEATSLEEPALDFLQPIVDEKSLAVQTASSETSFEDYPPTGVVLNAGSWGAGYKWYVYQGPKADLKRHYVFCMEHGKTMYSGLYSFTQNSGVFSSEKDTFRIAVAMDYFKSQGGWNSEDGYADGQYVVWNIGGTDTAKKLIRYANHLWSLTEVNEDRKKGASSYSSSVKAIKKSNLDAVNTIEFPSSARKKLEKTDTDDYYVKDKTISVTGSAWKYFANGADGYGDISVYGCYDVNGEKLPNDQAKASVGNDGKVKVSFNQEIGQYGEKNAPVTIVFQVKQAYSGAASIGYLNCGESKQKMSFDAAFSSPAYFAMQVYAEEPEPRKEYATVSINKVDELGNPVDGAKFKLTGTYDSGESYVSEIVSGTDSTFQEIKQPGNFWLTETEPAPGMKELNWPINFKATEQTVDNVKKIILSQPATLPAGISLSASDDNMSFTFTYVNKYEDGDAELKKIGNIFVKWENGRFVYEDISLDDVGFSFYTAEDIYLNDTLLWEADTLLTQELLDASIWNKDLGHKAAVYSQTGSSGRISCENLPAGNYYTVETYNRNPGYVVYGTRLDFTITPGVRTNINDGFYYNKPIYAECTVKKVDAEQKDEAGNAIPLSGAEFTLYAHIDNTNFMGFPLFTSDMTQSAVVSRDEYGEEVIQSNTWVPLKKVSSNENGVADFNLQMPYGKYMVVETSSPDNYGYPVGDSYIFNHYYDENESYPNGKVFTHTFENREYSNLLVVHKLGETLVSSSTKNTKYGSYHKLEYNYLEAGDISFDIIDEEGKIVETITTKQDGTANSSNLEAGEYTVVEKDNSGKYKLDTTPQKVVIEENKVAKVQKQELRFLNEKIKTEIGLYKKAEIATLAENVSVDANGSSIVYDYQYVPVENVVFGLYTKNSIMNYCNEVVVDADSCMGYITTDKNGYASFKGSLPAGEYYFKEIKPVNDDYIPDETKYEFEIILNGKDIQKDIVSADDAIVNDLYKGSIKAIKTNEDKTIYLEGVKFNLYNANKKLLGTFLTDSNGEIKIDKLPVGKYYLQEVETLEDYVLDRTLREIDLTNTNLEQVINIVNVKKPTEVKGSIKVIKTNEKKTYYLEGVKFNLYDGNKNLLGEYITDENGEIHITDLPLGTYYIEESETLEGYILDDTIHQVDLTDTNLDQVIHIINKERDTSITVETDTTIRGRGGVRTGDYMIRFITMLFMFSMIAFCYMYNAKRKTSCANYNNNMKGSRKWLLMLAVIGLIIPSDLSMAAEKIEIERGTFITTDEKYGSPCFVEYDGCVYALCSGNGTVLYIEDVVEIIEESGSEDGNPEDVENTEDGNTGESSDEDNTPYYTIKFGAKNKSGAEVTEEEIKAEGLILIGRTNEEIKEIQKNILPEAIELKNVSSNTSEIAITIDKHTYNCKDIFGATLEDCENVTLPVMGIQLLPNTYWETESKSSFESSADSVVTYSVECAELYSGGVQHPYWRCDDWDITIPEEWDLDSFYLGTITDVANIESRLPEYGTWTEEEAEEHINSIVDTYFDNTCISVNNESNIIPEAADYDLSKMEEDIRTLRDELGQNLEPGQNLDKDWKTAVKKQFQLSVYDAFAESLVVMYDGIIDSCLKDMGLSSQQYRTGKIIYKLNGGYLPIGTSDRYIINKHPELPTPARKNYKFKGWYTTEDFIHNTHVELALSSYNMNGKDITVYAAWEFYVLLEQNGINYQINSKKVAEVLPGEYSGAIELPETIEYENYRYPVTKILTNAFAGTNITSIYLPETIDTIESGVFDGCSLLTDITADSLLLSAENIPSNVNLKAYAASNVYKEYMANHYTGTLTAYHSDITYVLNGGTNSPENPDAYNWKSTLELKNPTKENAVFDGWYTDGLFSKSSKVEKIHENTYRDITLYAKWIETIPAPEEDSTGDQDSSADVSADNGNIPVTDSGNSTENTTKDETLPITPPESEKTETSETTVSKITKPGKVKKITLKNVKKKKIKVTIKKVFGADGYEIRYATNKKFKGVKKVTTKKTSYTIKKLKKGKTYYVKVRAFRYDENGKKLYGKYSSVKKIKVRK